MSINQDPLNWNDVILDISERTIKEIVAKGPSAIIDDMSRQQRVVNRIWCKALVRYLMNNSKWMKEEGNALKLKKLSNFTQCLRREVSYSKYGHGSRINTMYKRMIIRIKFGGVGKGDLGWVDPYRVLVSIIFDNELIGQVLGTDNFTYRDQVQEAVIKLDV